MNQNSRVHTKQRNLKSDKSEKSMLKNYFFKYYLKEEEEESWRGKHGVSTYVQLRSPPLLCLITSDQITRLMNPIEI